MENILQQLADYARYRTEEEKKRIPLVEVRRQAEGMETNTGFPFEKAIGERGMSMICEVKRASPSKGLIAPDFPYREIALDYEEAGASAISCLTEPRWFLGNDQYLSDISGQVRIPVLRKDFTVDPYMIFRAKILGASAVLLICAILETEQIRSYIQVADSLGLSALVEAHEARGLLGSITGICGTLQWTSAIPQGSGSWFRRMCCLCRRAGSGQRRMLPGFTEAGRMQS